MMSAADVLTLARLYAVATGLSLTMVGIRACNNDKIFRRLAEGKGANTQSVDRAGRWFSENWPEGAAWPEGVPRPEPVR